MVVFVGEENVPRVCFWIKYGPRDRFVSVCSRSCRLSGLLIMCIFRLQNKMSALIFQTNLCGIHRTNTLTILASFFKLSRHGATVMGVAIVEISRAPNHIRALAGLIPSPSRFHQHTICQAAVRPHTHACLTRTENSCSDDAWTVFIIVVHSLC